MKLPIPPHIHYYTLYLLSFQILTNELDEESYVKRTQKLCRAKQKFGSEEHKNIRKGNKHVGLCQTVHC